MAQSKGRTVGKTPLARWLVATRKTQAQFIADCRVATGLVLHPEVVSRWARGQALPNQHSRALIASLSEGAVPPDAWLSKKKRAA